MGRFYDTGVSPFLQGETRLQKQGDEDWLIRFLWCSFTK